MSAASPEEVRETARRVLAGDDYRLGTETPPGANVVASVLEWVGEQIRRIWEFVMPDRVPMPGDGVLPEAPLRIAAIAAGVLLLLVLAHLAYRVYRGRRRDKDAPLAPEEPPPPADVLAERAQALAGEGLYADASRILYRAALTRLEEARGGRFQTGLTNTEYLRTFRAPWVLEHLRVFVDLINWKWYRDNRIDREDYRRCEEAYRNLDLRLREEAS